MFDSMEDFKKGAEFRRKGSVIPRWVLKASKRKKQHLTVFGSNCWIRRYKGYLIIACDGWYQYAVKFKRISEMWTYDLKTNPYGCGKTRYIPLRIDQLDIINRVISGIDDLGTYYWYTKSSNYGGIL